MKGGVYRMLTFALSCAYILVNNLLRLCRGDNAKVWRNYPETITINNTNRELCGL